LLVCFWELTVCCSSTWQEFTFEKYFGRQWKSLKEFWGIQPIPAGRYEVIIEETIVPAGKSQKKIEDTQILISRK
jgi:hypothetical protein